MSSPTARNSPSGPGSASLGHAGRAGARALRGCSVPTATALPPRVGSPGPGASPPAPGPARPPPPAGGRCPRAVLSHPVPFRAAQRGAGQSPAQPRHRGARGRPLPSPPRPAPAARTRAPARRGGLALFARLRAAPPAGPAARPAHGGAAVPARPLPREPPLTCRRSVPAGAASARAQQRPVPAPLTAGPRALRGRQAGGGCGRGRDPGPAAAGRRGRHFAVPIPAMGLPEVCRAGPGPRPPRVPGPHSAANAPGSATAAGGAGPLPQAVHRQPLSV